MRELTLLGLAAVAYAVGGLFMKASAGVTRIGPSVAFLALFIAGALMQARGMKGTELSVGYVIVLGLEAVVAVLIGVLYLEETLSASRAAAIALIVAGVAWLRAA